MQTVTTVSTSPRRSDAHWGRPHSCTAACSQGRLREKPYDNRRQWEANSQRPTNYQRKRQKQTYPSPQLMQRHAAAPSSSPCENHLKIAVNEGRIIKLA